MADKLYTDVMAAMEKGTPVAKYSKAIMGRLNVRILDVVTGEPHDIIMSGDASKGDEDAILVFWTPVECAYFERANKIHLAEGNLVPYFTPETVQASVNSVSDEEIKRALEARYFTTLKLLRSFTNPTPALRMLAIAEQMNKPVGTINAIKARVSELQADEFKDK